MLEISDFVKSLTHNDVIFQNFVLLCTVFQRCSGLAGVGVGNPYCAASCAGGLVRGALLRPPNAVFFLGWTDCTPGGCLVLAVAVWFRRCVCL